MSASKGFFNLLFEFSFSRFIGIKIIGVLYGIGIFFTGLLTLMFLAAGFSQDFLRGVGALIVSPFLFLLYVILLRITLEGFVAALRTAENTTQLVENAKRID
jgi:Domain of unknown function (DUF4282)